MENINEDEVFDSQIRQKPLLRVKKKRAMNLRRKLARMGTKVSKKEVTREVKNLTGFQRLKKVSCICWCIVFMR